MSSKPDAPAKDPKLRSALSPSLALQALIRITNIGDESQENELWLTLNGLRHMVLQLD
jgi:hypothetical protein